MHDDELWQEYHDNGEPVWSVGRLRELFEAGQTTRQTPECYSQLFAFLEKF